MGINGTPVGVVTCHEQSFPAGVFYCLGFPYFGVYQR